MLLNADQPGLAAALIAAICRAMECDMLTAWHIFPPSTGGNTSDRERLRMEEKQGGHGARGVRNPHCGIPLFRGYRFSIEDRMFEKH